MAAAATVAAGAALGASPPAPVIQVDANDESMLIMCGTGASALATGTICTITLGGTYSQNVTGQTPPAIDVPALKFTVNPASAAAAPLQLYYDASTSTPRTVVIKCAVAPVSTGLLATLAGIVLVVRGDL